MFQEEDDVFGFTSFESTFEIENKFKILEKYSSKETEFCKNLTNVEFDVCLFYNFYSLGVGKLFPGTLGLCFDGISRLNITWEKILEIGLKKDPESEQDLLNLKLDSQVYLQFSCVDLNSLLKEFETISPCQPTYPPKPRVSSSFSPRPDFTPKELESLNQIHSDKNESDNHKSLKELQDIEGNFNLKVKNINEKKLKLMQEISSLDQELLEIERDYHKKKLELVDNQCNLCFDSIVQVVFRPCGHEICLKCLENLKTHDFTLCPWDRLQVQTEISNKF